MTGNEEVKESGTLIGSGWRIERESSESAYSWDSKRSGKTGIV